VRKVKRRRELEKEGTFEEVIDGSFHCPSPRQPSWRGELKASTHSSPARVRAS